MAIRGNHQVRAPIGEVISGHQRQSSGPSSNWGGNQWPSEAIIRSELQLGTILDSRHEAELDVSGAGTRFVSQGPSVGKPTDTPSNRDRVGSGEA